jgi:hypothetical protein
MIPVASCFSQLLSLVDRANFARAVRQHQAERGAKGFSCWDQFVAMLFCQMGGANSLREICGGLATATGKLVHLEGSTFREPPLGSGLSSEHKGQRKGSGVFSPSGSTTSRSSTAAEVAAR